MDESGFALDRAKVVIIGLGLMGGSLALALKGCCRKLDGIDNHAPTLALARQLNIVDTASGDPVEILTDADLVILACPVPAIIDWLNRLPIYIQHPCIVLDLGSTKQAIVSAMDDLPENFDPIGGHAICGKERLSIKNAERTLFLDAPFMLTRLNRTSKEACNAALQIAEISGAYPVWIDAEAHDRILAATSHLPYLLSSALSLVIPVDAAALIGPGFISTSRLAGTPSSMMLGVLKSNRDNILTVLRTFKEQLSAIEDSLKENNGAQLESILDMAKNRYQSLTQQNLTDD